MGSFGCGKSSQRVIECDFHRAAGANDVRPAGHHLNFLVEGLNGASGSFGAELVQQEYVVGAKHAGDFVHRVRHFLQIPGRGPLVGHQSIELLPGPPRYPFRPARQ